MKPNQFIIFFLFLLFTSCTSSKIIELGGQVSNKGVDASRKALSIYSTLSQQANIDKSQQDKIKVLIHPSPATMTLPNTSVRDFSQQITPRIQAYKNLLNVYNAFAVLSDSKYSDKTKEALNALKDSYSSIEKLPNLSDKVQSKLPSIGKMITESIQAKKVKQHNEILYNLSQIYLTLWQTDEKIWNDYLNQIYDSYAEGLNTVDSKRYDAKKISLDSKEPYGDENTIILMYRLRNRDEIFRQKNEVKKQLDDFGKALEELSKAHSEIAKQKTDITTIISSLNKIENILKEK